LPEQLCRLPCSPQVHAIAHRCGAGAPDSSFCQCPANLAACWRVALVCFVFIKYTVMQVIMVSWRGIDCKTMEDTPSAVPHTVPDGAVRREVFCCPRVLAGMECGDEHALALVIYQAVFSHNAFCRRRGLVLKLWAAHILSLPHWCLQHQMHTV
jgi:hypothetical protein